MTAESLDAATLALDEGLIERAFRGDKTVALRGMTVREIRSFMLEPCSMI